MEINIRDTFIRLWDKYFGKAELPITFYYTDEEGHAQLVEPGSVSRCVIGALTEVRKGSSLCFGADSIGCPGGKRYLGFAEGIMPGFEYFLSYGIPGRLEGERYCKTPELVREIMKNTPTFQAPGRYIVFKRWDRLDESDNPEVVIFYAKPDVLSGLFTLARFDEVDRNAVSAPFGSGCSTIVQYPYLEKGSEHPKAIIGMFDPSARPSVPHDVITFSVSVEKLVGMLDNMEESFLITGTWSRIKKRIDSVLANRAAI